MSMFHKKWLSHETTNPSSFRKHHHRFLNFSFFLNLLRKPEEDPVASVGCVSLRIPVQQHIFNRSQFGWYDNSAHVLYMNVKGPVNSYRMFKRASYHVYLV